MSATVVIPVWDAYCGLLRGSVDSALAEGARVVVVDNRSSEALPALPSQVRVVRLHRRLSAGAARNAGLAATETPLVLFLDADDRLLPGAISRLAGRLAAEPDAIAAVGKHLLWNPLTGEERVVARAPRPLVRHLARLRRSFAALTLRHDCFPLVGCGLIRTDAARDAGGFGDASLAEDWMLRSALAFRGRIAFDPEPVVRVRVRDGSLWHREHSRAELEAMYDTFATHRARDPKLPRWARGLLPFISRVHRREARRRTRAGGFRPPDRGLGVAASPRAPEPRGTLSVVVCTHERPEHLRACLQALAAEPEPPEVIVVDSGSAVPCPTLVDGFRDRIERLRFVHVPEPGLSRARNAGVAAAGGSIVAFLDDDATVEPGWQDAIRAAFAERPLVGCVGGACLPAFAGERPRWLSDRLLQLSSITRYGDAGHEPRSSAEWPFGANMAFRRAVLDEVGGFSEELGRTGSSLLSGEDSDMVARVLAAGWRVWLEPRAVVLHAVHAERLRSRFYWRRLWWAGISRARQPGVCTTLRLLAALPIRLALWSLTRDRMYLYRLAESAGYLTALAGLTGR